MDRRHFLASMVSPLLASCEFRNGKPVYGGEVLGPDMAIGHKLRDRGFGPPTETRKLPIAIVGGGIGGLSAAWRLAKRGIRDFKLFELEAQAGGNARAGVSQNIPHPWGAHYLPYPTLESMDVRLLLADLGVLQGDPAAAVPRYDERYIVSVPQERLYIQGLWQEGITPRITTTPRDQEQYQRFDELISVFKEKRDAQGRKAFALPSPLSSRDSAYTDLDKLSLRDWMRQQGLDSSFLHWYADYGCRDDYGAHAGDISAWAGLHYYAARDGQAWEADSHGVLTWPEGNGWLVRQTLAWLAKQGAGNVETRSACVRVQTYDGHAEIDIYHAQEDRVIRYRVEQLIWAAPAQVLARVWANPPAGFTEAVMRIPLSPWLVANLTLDHLPEDAGPAGMAWDNVIYNSPALGYVVATHQTVAVKPGATVLTYYWPLADAPIAQSRQRLYETPWKTWADTIINELSRPHPALRSLLKRIDIWRWPHAMARPVPGFLSAPARAALSSLQRPLAFAHADMTGISLFEEANYAGVRAANFAR